MILTECIFIANCSRSISIGPFLLLSAPPLLKGYYGSPLGNNFQHMHPLEYLEWRFYPLGNPLYLKTLSEMNPFGIMELVRGAMKL